MNNISRIQTRPTLADAIAVINADDSLSPIRKRDLTSAIKLFCRHLDRDPSLMPADIPMLKAALATLHPALLGIAMKTFQNMKTNVLAAVKHVRGNQPAMSRRRALAPAWERLWALLPNKRLRNGLSRFIHYCSDHGVAPEDVTDLVIAKFMVYVRTQTFAPKPNNIHRTTTRVWNEAAETLPEWPKVKLTVPDFRKPRESMPLEAFLQSFQEDVQEHLGWLAGNNIFAPHPPPKVCKPRTVEQRRTFIILIISALLRQGWTIDQITSLADIVTVEAVKAVLTDYHERSNHEATTFMHSLAKAFIHIARHYVRVDANHIDALKDLRRRLGPEHEGMTEKNMATLRQFDDERNTLRLLDLPGDLVATVVRSKLSDERAAVRVQIALAIAILLCAPLRMHNLIGLRLDTHIIRPGGKRGPVHLVIPEDEAKGGQTIEYPLPDRVKDLLDRYFGQYRPFLCGDDCPWLFPSGGGKQKSQTTLSQQIKKTVFEHTGLTMTPHQFRHLAAKLLLDQNPGQYESVRQLLAHKSTKSTMNFYAGFQTPNAAKHYDQMVTEKHAQLSQQYDDKGRKK